MKKHILPFVFALSFLTVFISFMSGPANRGHDKTGSPLSNGSCFDCHASGSFSPSLNVKMLDNNMETDEYEPGKSYQIQLELSSTSSPASFGFQTVALDENDNNAGTFSNLPSGFQQIELGDATYVEHSSPRPSNIVTLDWTAPAESQGDITFYAGSVAANANNGTSGDGGATTSFTIKENTTAIESILADTKMHSYLKSNFVDNNLILQTNDLSSTSFFTIFNSGGQIIKNGMLHQDQLENGISVANLSSGLYYLTLRSEGTQRTEKFYKK